MSDTEALQAYEDYVFISALNQYNYCPLRCYWMYVEHEYADNEHTIEGTLGHARGDSPRRDDRRRPQRHQGAQQQQHATCPDPAHQRIHKDCQADFRRGPVTLPTAQDDVQVLERR